MNIDDDLLKKASEATGITEKTALVRMGLEMIIAKHSRERLIAFGGSMKNLPPFKRKRPWSSK